MEISRITAIATLLAAGAPAAMAQDFSADEHFSGKTIRMIVSWSAGGTGDAYIRILAQHFPEHIPGTPSIVVENMPGGGHNIATNYMYTQAEPTGLVIGTFGGARAVASAKGDPGVNFDASKFKYLGSLAGFGAVCMAAKDTGLQSAKDLVGASETWIVGDVAPDGAGPTVVNLLADALGWNARAITGYASDADVNLAMQRGEVSGSCGPYSGFATDAAWADKFTPLFNIGLKRDPNLPDVPTVFEIGELPSEIKDALEAYTLRFEVSVPLYVPPDTPDEVVGVLRQAVEDVLQDPDYIEQSRKAGRPLDGAMTGEDAQASIQRIHEVSPSAWETLSKAQQ